MQKGSNSSYRLPGSERKALRRPKLESVTEESTEPKTAPLITDPLSWTPDFCQQEANAARGRNDFERAFEWRKRFHVLDNLKKGKPHPYGKMRVNAEGDEVSGAVIPLSGVSRTKQPTQQE